MWFSRLGALEDQFDDPDLGVLRLRLLEGLCIDARESEKQAGGEEREAGGHCFGRYFVSTFTPMLKL